MSSPNPPLSPFVHGTTDSSNVYFLQANVRRLIPDDVTLKQLLGGQTVRVLTDADLGAIPLGPPLPSRKDGTLLAQQFPVPPPNPIVYLMGSGRRRQIPDRETLLILQAGSQVTSIAPADLEAIPQGDPLPTRRDGTLYRGTGVAFAYLIQSGHKRSIPNATTLRDAGFAVTSLLPIGAADAAMIPDGDPMASTSRFLSPPPSKVPLVLLPVRLETRFQGTELWLRVYPDTIHANTFEPELTDDERAARNTYLAAAESGTSAARVAFADLAQRFGNTRAAWIASSNVPTASKASQWTRAPFTNVLPERWIVIGYQGNEPGQVLTIGPAIQDPLPMGPAPTGSGPTSDDGIKWMSDFNRAIQVGMAFRIGLSEVQQRGFNRIVVLGLRTGLDPKSSAARLGELLQAHHYTDGLELLGLNTPTNNTESAPAGFSSKQTDFDALFDLEQGPSLCPSRSTADGDRFARSLNIAPSLLSHVRGANGAQDEQASAMNAVLWPATWGYYLSQLVAEAVPNPQTMLPAARDHFATTVRARGHFPTIRIGRQPYGFLPVCWSAAWKPLEGRPLDAPLASLLARLRGNWDASLPNVPRLPGSPDPDAALVSILGMTPSSVSYIARNVIGPEYNTYYWNFVQKDLPNTWWTTLSKRTLAHTVDLSSVFAGTRLANSTFVSEQRQLTDVLVAPAPLDGVAAPDFVSNLATLGWQVLRSGALPPLPVPLLYLLLRHAALREYMDTALDLLTTAGAAQAAERIEAEMVGFVTAAQPTAWDILQRELPGHGPVGNFLDTVKTGTAVPAFAAYWSSFAKLAQFSAADLDAAAREVFDLASYRLDSWVTSLAYVRLDNLRSSQPDGGTVLGAYGWLENVRPQPQQAKSAGFVHAPSLDQAVTAAVLRSGYLAHANGSQGPFQIDLSSRRVRLALHLMDGVREGQSLGALLGYRLERSLHDLSLDTYIDNLRNIAPAETATGPLDVVDGLALLRKFHSDDSFWGAPGLPPDGTADRISLTNAINGLDDALDSVADLALSESVHQLIRGNTVRAGATLDAIARGDTPPPDPEIVKTPRAGSGLTYRLMVIATGGALNGWTTTPRAQAEPRLNAWAGSILGNPVNVRIRASYTSPGATTPSFIEIGADQLGFAPLDVLALPESQNLPAELTVRLLRAFTQALPSTVPPETKIEILTDRSPSWKPQIIGVIEWLGLAPAISRLVNAARPMEPSDLILPGDANGTIDTAELQLRADTAEQQMGEVLAALKSPSAGDKELLSATAFGVAGALPDANSENWPDQIAGAAAELASRAGKLNGLVKGSQDVERLQTIFGKSFTVLPVLSAQTAAGWPQLWANSSVLDAGDSQAPFKWFQRAARVRPGAARLQTALMFAEALAGQTLGQFQVAQLPFTAGDKWVALQAANATQSRLSLVAFSSATSMPASAIAGLLIDEWTEVWPSSKQITGVSFQYTDPAARAPQAILLAVPPDDFPEWTMEAVEGSILEALTLAHYRTVDPDSLVELGHFLPALYFAYNTGGADETVSTDFNTVLRQPLASNS